MQEDFFKPWDLIAVSYHNFVCLGFFERVEKGRLYFFSLSNVLLSEKKEREGEKRPLFNWYVKCNRVDIDYLYYRAVKVDESCLTHLTKDKLQTARDFLVRNKYINQ